MSRSAEGNELVGPRHGRRCRWFGLCTSDVAADEAELHKAIDDAGDRRRRDGQARSELPGRDPGGLADEEEHAQLGGGQAHFGPGAEAEWIEAYRKLFEARFEALDEIIREVKQE